MTRLFEREELRPASVGRMRFQHHVGQRADDSIIAQGCSGLPVASTAGRGLTDSEWGVEELARLYLACRLGTQLSSYGYPSQQMTAADNTGLTALRQGQIAIVTSTRENPGIY